MKRSRNRIISLLCILAMLTTMMVETPQAQAAAASSDPLVNEQWAIQKVKANSFAGKQKKNTVVAVLDTGVDWTNPDLANRMWTNPYDQAVLPGNYGYDFAEDDSEPMDTYGHGTHCAGIIAAQRGNNEGIRGISTAKIMALKISKDNSAIIDEDAAVKAFEYVYQAQCLGTNVVAVNCSWCGASKNSAQMRELIQKIEDKGANVIFAAGNSGINWEEIPNGQRKAPYDLKTDDMLIVGAVNENGNVAGYSDSGRTMVDIFAPGSDILSTVQTESFLPYTYTKAKKKTLVSYENNTAVKTRIFTAATAEIESDTALTVTVNQKKGFQNPLTKERKCFVVKAKNPNADSLSASAETENQEPLWTDEKENAGYLYLDVTGRNYDPEKTYVMSCLVGTAVSATQISWSKVQLTSTKDHSRFLTKNGKQYLALVGFTAGALAGGTFYVDNLAVSKGNPDTSRFGKYDLMSGTSMAAPLVTGAVALIASKYPNLTPAQRKEVILDSANITTKMENRCLAGGIIDFSQFKTSIKNLN